MDLWRLTVFCRVVEQKSFSKAGNSVHLSQPTVSSHIRDLEAHFNCKLIDRLPKEAVPTAAGRILYRHALKLLALKDEMETDLGQFQGTVKGRLSVGGSTIPGTYLLPRVISAFSAAYPFVTVSLRIGDTKRTVEEVLEGALALGVVGAETKDRRIRQELLCQDDMGLAVPPGHPWAEKKRVDLKNACDEPFILREAGSGTRASMEASLLKRGYRIEDLNVVAEMGSTEAVRQGVKSRLGVSILSKIALEEDLRAGLIKMISIGGLNLTRGIYLISHSQKTLSPLADAFSQFMKAYLIKDDCQ